MSRITLPSTLEHVSAIQALVDNGWQGKWNHAEDGFIGLDGCEGTLAEFIHKQGPLNYYQTVQLVLNLGTQITALAQLEKGLTSLCQNDIVVCDGFVISNMTNSATLKNDFLEIVRPVDIHSCTSPEMEQLDTLPSVVHVSAIYYNIASLCLESMDISHEMREIQGSKLYYMLRRCLRHDPQTREFLYI